MESIMNKALETYMHVLASTHPELKQVFMEMMGKVDTQTVERYLESPIYHPVLVDLSSIVQGYSSNYNKINMVLNRLSDLVSIVSRINYEHLTDEQREELPGLAGEVDKINHHIREEIYPQAIQRQEVMKANLLDRYKYGLGYVNQANQEAVNIITSINEKFGTDIQWSEGKAIVSTAELDAWIDRNNQVDQKILDELRKSDEPEAFIKALVTMECMQKLAHNHGEDQADLEKRIYKAIKKHSVQELKYEELGYQPGEFVDTVEELSERTLSLQEKIEAYPVKEDEGDDNLLDKLDKLTKNVKVEAVIGNTDNLSEK